MQKFLLSLVLLGGIFPLKAQFHNRVIKLNTGISTEQLDYSSTIKRINDTSKFDYDFISWSPVISYTHEFVVNPVLSVSGNLGYQYLNINYNYQHFGSPFLFFGISPQISIFYRNGFEYYVRLRAGGSVFFQDKSIIDNQHDRYFPETFNFYTGFTFGGFNYFLNDNWGLNLELSIWSPELATFGVSYRFFKGELPEIINNSNNE